MAQDLARMVYEYLGNPFITTWRLPENGSLRLPLPRGILLADCDSPDLDRGGESDVTLPYNCIVDWGDGSPSCEILAYDDRAATHVYSNAGDYTVHITGLITGFCCGASFWDHHFYKSAREPPGEKLHCISQWGCLQLRSGRRAFERCFNLTITASDAPQLQDVTDLSKMFRDCVTLRKEDLSSWQTNGVTSMCKMFENCSHFDGNVSTWSTRAVVNMKGMFDRCGEFNGDLSQWNTCSVTDMTDMFRCCHNFRGDLSRWNTDSVTVMTGLFQECKYFKGELSNWNTSRVLAMARMFEGCESYNGDLSKWDTSEVTNMHLMFARCSSFQGRGLSRWKTGNVRNMSYMFERCSSFQGGDLLRGWQTGSVVSMEAMFKGCKCFNGDLSTWDTRYVINMREMFYDCNCFNGDLSQWDTSRVGISGNTFAGCWLFDGNVGGRLQGISPLLHGCENIGMNPSVTPTRHELEDCLPSLPLDVAGIVYDYVGNPFVTLWEVPAGIFRLPLGRFEEGFARRTEEGFARSTEEDFANDFLVNWGDGESNHIHNDYFPSHTYSAAGRYRVHITGTIRGFCCGGSRHHTVHIIEDRHELLEVSQWGCLQLLNGSRPLEIAVS